MPDTTNTLLLIAIALLAGVLVAFAGLLRRSASTRRFNRTTTVSSLPATPRNPEPPAPVAESILQRLTPREREVALLAARGLTNRQIAAELNLSVNTVSNHLKRVYAKLDVGSRAELGWRLQYLDLDLDAGAPPDVAP
jgi:DNA-binding NarL/FixJ family response regulator